MNSFLKADLQERLEQVLCQHILDGCSHQDCDASRPYRRFIAHLAAVAADEVDKFTVEKRIA